MSEHLNKSQRDFRHPKLTKYLICSEEPPEDALDIAQAISF